MLTRRASVLLSIGVFALVTISQFPMKLALSLALPEGSTAFSASDVRGSVWSGTFTGARIGALDLGEVKARGNPLGLLSGVLRSTLSWQSSSGRGEAKAVMESGAIALEALTARIVVTGGFLSGVASVSEGALGLSGDACTRAEGRVAFTLSDNSQTYDGTLTCTAGALSVLTEVNGQSVTVPLAAS